jgi:type II secretory pathway component PulM
LSASDISALTRLRTQVFTQIRDALAALNTRERRILIGGVLLVALTLVWLLYSWQADTRHQLDTAVPRATAQLARMQSESAELARLHSVQPPAPADLAQLAGTLTSSSAAHGLSLSVRNDGNQLVVSGKGVNFDNWVQWLAETQRASAIRLTYLDVTQAAGGAQLEARLTPL